MNETLPWVIVVAAVVSILVSLITVSLITMYSEDDGGKADGSTKMMPSESEFVLTSDDGAVTVMFELRSDGTVWVERSFVETEYSQRRRIVLFERDQSEDFPQTRPRSDSEND